MRQPYTRIANAYRDSDFNGDGHSYRDSDGNRFAPRIANPISDPKPKPNPDGLRYFREHDAYRDLGCYDSISLSVEYRGFWP